MTASRFPRACLLAGLALAALALAACQPLPAPTPDTRNDGLADGAVVVFSNSWLHWTPASPARYGSDSYEIEFLSSSGAPLFSQVIDDWEVVERGNPLGIYWVFEGESTPVGGRFLNVRVACGQTYRWHVRQLRGTSLSPW